jgi:hypothetical protein
MQHDDMNKMQERYKGVYVLLLGCYTEIPGMDLETKMKKTDCYISVTPPKISIAFLASQRPSHPIYNHAIGDAWGTRRRK